jgi:uncharacterized protein with NAD-binding domain and iron-sulfur cluster
VPSKKKVVILGGGPAAVSTAFWLTSTPALQERYDVSMYTLGWRLGGKCASGRDSENGDSIQEHGLHILLGCYDCAFATIRKCFEEWNNQVDWRTFFTREEKVALGTQLQFNDPQDVDHWEVSFPSNELLPGDTLTTWDPTQSTQAISDLNPLVDVLTKILDFIRSYAAAQFRLAEFRAETDFDGAFQRTLLHLNQARQRRFDSVKAAETAKIVRDENLKIVEKIREIERSDIELNHQLKGRELRKSTKPIAMRALQLTNLGLALSSGWLEDLSPVSSRALPGATGLSNLLEQSDYDAINHLDFREWLRRHWVAETTLASAPIKAIYDLAFAYRGGDSEAPDIAAGVTLRFALELLMGYKGSPLWKMNGGMGDTLFVPFYDVLKARGVKINLFSRVTKIEWELVNGENKVHKITLQRQAEPIQTGTGSPGDPPELDPFESINGKRVWPSMPKLGELTNLESAGSPEQFEDGAANQDSFKDFTLELDAPPDSPTHFDLAVIGIPPCELNTILNYDLDLDGIGAVESLVGGIKWEKALRNSSSRVPTVAFQLWSTKTTAELGWGQPAKLIGSLPKPFDTWSDMSHLLVDENWGTSPPKSIHYFCGSYPSESPDLLAPNEIVSEWINDHLIKIWPSLPAANLPVSPGLSDFVGATGFAHVYWRANHVGWQQYQQTRSDSVQHRLSPATHAPSLMNLYVVGDWTKTRFSGGCVESAFESGMLAARAICLESEA